MQAGSWQVRSWNASGGHSCRYYEGVSTSRAIELAVAADAAVCAQNVDYYAVHDYDSTDYDDSPVLVADCFGRPAITINVEMMA